MRPADQSQFKLNGRAYRFPPVALGAVEKRMRGKDKKPRKPRSDALDPNIVSQIREMRARGDTLKAIAAAFSISEHTVGKYGRGISPPEAGKSWSQFNAPDGRAMVPSEIIDNGDGTSTIKLSKGFEAVIDTVDVPKVAGFHWYARRSGRGDGTYGRYYAARCETRGPTIFLHSVIMPVRKGFVTDHKDRNPLNNRRDNLREATRAGNAINRSSKGTKSGYRGVCWHRQTGAWHASVMHEYRVRSCGYFKSVEEAARARDALAKKLQGDFAVLNFPEDAR